MHCDYLKSLLYRMGFYMEIEIKFQCLFWSVVLGIKPKAYHMLGPYPITEPYPGTLISQRSRESDFHLAERKPLLN